ncbi:MAG: arginine deiminase-related protein [Saprospiraceae bacterium]|nr:arginine deiminase-related protein [Saprospiraceae bacterium]MDW8483031.1 arginine deiminase-related protein [Saprospiraceae bacterium]
MRKQTTPYILMVRPACFGFNEETAANNAFQVRDNRLTAAEIQQRAREEFDLFVTRLREAGVHVLVAEDTEDPPKPDAVFPNNWVTFHQEGYLITYPMYAPTRRLERREEVIEKALEAGFKPLKRVHLEHNEASGRFLEGTGSVVFDHVNRLGYACLSPRTDEHLLRELCGILQYEPIIFHAVDANGREIYHTNVMMAIGETFAVICLATIRNATERAALEERLRIANKEVVPITIEQMQAFAGNMLQVRNDRSENLLVMSEQAFRSLTPKQVQVLEKHSRLLYSPLYTIETYGGGSARCMMAEVFIGE